MCVCYGAVVSGCALTRTARGDGECRAPWQVCICVRALPVCRTGQRRERTHLLGAGGKLQLASAFCGRNPSTPYPSVEGKKVRPFLVVTKFRVFFHGVLGSWCGSRKSKRFLRWCPRRRSPSVHRSLQRYATHDYVPPEGEESKYGVLTSSFNAG